jgi:hypothetical protein
MILAPRAQAGGEFESSDPLLNRIWASSVETARQMESEPVNLDQRDCEIQLPRVLLDGAVRDRCPYVGDLAVTGATLLIANDDVAALRDMIVWFASAQKEDGAIPASPLFNRSVVLVDYNAYWIETLYRYVLHTGDLSTLRSVLPNLVRLVDGLYAAHVSDGLLGDWLGVSDYAYIRRGDSRVAYYNAQYVRALTMAGSLSTWAGDPAHAAAWRARAATTSRAFSAFWDAAAGAFSDTPERRDVHPQDGNSFAILAGIATPAQARSALAYLSRWNRRSYGNTITDSTAWDRPLWGTEGKDRVYPFISYFEVLARYAAGSDGSALELIRRTWGFMATRPPGTMWETIGPGGVPVDLTPSFSHGWSSGAAPALTAFVLGVQPTAPGFARFTVSPRPGNLKWARGTVPTPHGLLRVSWTLVAGKPQIRVVAPRGTVWVNRAVKAAKKLPLRPR